MAFDGHTAEKKKGLAAAASALFLCLPVYHTEAFCDYSARDKSRRFPTRSRPPALGQRSPYSNSRSALTLWQIYAIVWHLLGGARFHRVKLCLLAGAALASRRDKWCGEIPEWPKGTDCKSVAECFRGSNPLLPTRYAAHIAQRQSTSLVKKRSWVRFPVWAGHPIRFAFSFDADP